MLDILPAQEACAYAEPLVLDCTAGNRSAWYPGHGSRVVYVDRREEVKPDIVADLGNLPFTDSVFDLAFFDPPFTNFGANGKFSDQYGHWTVEEIRALIGAGGRELHRVVKPTGFLVLKFGGKDLGLSRVLRLMPDWSPMFGQRAVRKACAQTSWTILRPIEKKPNRSRVRAAEPAVTGTCA